MSERTILVIDDDTTFTDMLNEVLTDEGYHVGICHDGATGLEEAMRSHPSVIIMDHMMPKMKGDAVLKALREDAAWGRLVPVMLLSNIQPSEEECADPHVKCLIKTDVTLDDIASTVRTLLEA